MWDIEAELVVNDLTRDQHYRRAIAVKLETTVDEVDAAGCAGTHAGGEFAVSIASAPAAKPAASSCRTSTQRIPRVLVASVTWWSVSPGML